MCVVEGTGDNNETLYIISAYLLQKQCPSDNFHEFTVYLEQVDWNMSNESVSNGSR